MVLGLDADAARAAVEGPGWPDNHASCTQGEGICFFVRVDDGGVLEAVVREKVGGTVTCVWPLDLRFVLNMDAILLETLITNLRTPLARNRRNDTGLCHCTAVDQSEQVADTCAVDQVGQDAANQTEQLQVSDAKKTLCQTLIPTLPTTYVKNSTTLLGTTMKSTATRAKQISGGVTLSPPLEM